MTSSDQIAAGVQHGIENSAGKVAIRVRDRRLLIMFVFVITFIVLSLLWQEHTTSDTRAAQHKLSIAQDQIAKQQTQIIAAQRAAFTVCQATNTGNEKFNTVLDQLATNVNNSTALTAPQKQEALATYASLHLVITDCSHLAGQ